MVHRLNFLSVPLRLKVNYEAREATLGCCGCDELPRARSLPLAGTAVNF